MATRNTALIFFVLSLSTGHGQSPQDSDSTSHKNTNYWKEFRAPIILTAAGFIATIDNPVVDKWDVREWRQVIAPDFRTHIDNYLWAVPVVSTYALDIAGVQPRSDMINQTVLLIKSEIVVAALTLSLKTFANVERPDGTTHDSFPSGHTSHAFMAATFLHKEFGRDHPWITVLGYTTATGVGVLRILNDRHWLSDVLVGAGIGIFSPNLVYLTHQYKWGNRSSRGQARILPYYQQGAAGIYVAYNFTGH